MSNGYDLDSGPDPAAFAASQPETDAISADPVYAVGIGPGNVAYLPPRGRQEIRDADVVVGFETVVEHISTITDADLLTCGYRDEGETLVEFANRVDGGQRGTAVLMGDPNHSGYQFLGKVEKRVDAPVRVIPGISSVQVAASRARTPMEETVFVTLHKSGEIAADLDRLREHVGQRHLLVLPRTFDFMPTAIAADLMEWGAAGDLETLVLERLTHDEETITRTTLDELAGKHQEGTDSPFSDLSVLVIRAEFS